MRKKFFLFIFVIILLFGICFFANSQTPDNHVKIGHTDFTLPDGYVKGNLNKNTDLNYTNGTNSIFINYYDDGDINKHIDELKEYISKQNKSYSIQQYVASDIQVFKLTIQNDTLASYYWFVCNNNVYRVYCWDGNNDMDNIVNNLIKSAHYSFF